LQAARPGDRAERRVRARRAVLRERAAAEYAAPVVRDRDAGEDEPGRGAARQALAREHLDGTSRIRVGLKPDSATCTPSPAAKTNARSARLRASIPRGCRVRRR